MKSCFTAWVFFCALFMGVVNTNLAQSLQTSQVTIIDDLPRTYSNAKKVYGKTASCPVDTVNYPFYKATQLLVVSLTTQNSGNIFAQWYDAQQAITISGFDFYGWNTSGASNQVVQLTCRIYAANPNDSLPAGTPLATTMVNVDTTFGGGTLSNLRRQVVFSSPVTVSTPYVLTVETSSSTTVNIVSNSWTAATPNGRSEWLSSVKIGNTFNRSYLVTIGSPPVTFNADFLLQPYVSYSLTADFLPSTLCVKGSGNPITFTNQSSWVLFNKFYNTRAFYNVAYISCQWDFGDTTGTWYAMSPTHNYNYRTSPNVRLRDTLFGFTTGCADVKVIPLTAAPPSVTARSNSPVCSGYQIKLSADTLPNASGYYWTGPNGFTSNLQHPVINNASAIHQGNYNLVAILGNCTSSVSVVNIAIMATPQAISNSPVCEGQTLSLSTSSINGATYNWTGPNNFGSTLQSPSRSSMSMGDTGIYSVSITSAGCGTIGPFNTQVVVNAIPPTPSASNNGPLCVGDNLNLTSTGINGNYKWTGPNGFLSNVQNLSRPGVLASYAGIYSVSVTQNGCSSNAATTTVVINNNPATPVVSNNGPLCVGQTLSLTASLIANATYQWSGPNGFASTTQNPVRSNLTLIDAGNYSVVATLNGCSSPAGTTAVVIGSSTPAPTASYNGPLCPGQTLQLAASSIPGATYSWTGPNNFTSSVQNPSISNITNAEAGMYSVTATTSSCGTSSASTIAVVINTLPSAPVIGNNGPLCDGDSLILTASNVPGAVYNWSGPLGFLSNTQNPVIKSMNAAKAGTYSVYVDVTGCGSSSASTTQVQVRRIPQTPVATSNAPVCESDTLKLNTSVFGVGPSRTFSWSGPNNFTSSFQNTAMGNAASDMAGIYAVTVTDSGCTSQPGSVNVSVKSRPASPIATNNSPVCTGNDVQLSASGIAGATYKWSGPGGYLSGLQNPLLNGKTGMAIGTYFVSVTVNGCNSPSASTNVQLYPLPPEPVASNDGPVCSGNPVSLSSNPIPNVTYSWTGPSGFTSSDPNPVLANAKVGMSGIYSLTVIDSHCVSKPDTTLVIVNAIPAAPVVSSFPAGTNFCSGDSIQLFATFQAGAIYEWSGPAGFGSFLQNPVLRNINPAFTGTYSVVLSRNNCQAIPVSIAFTVHPLPQTSNILGPDSVLTGDLSDFLVSGDSGSVFNWIAFGGAIQGAATGVSIQVRWGNNPGGGFVRVRETGVSGCRGPLVQQNVVITKPAPSGLSAQSRLISELKVYPVPAGQELKLELHAGQLLQHATWCMYNMLGVKVNHGTLMIPAGPGTYAFDVQSLATGIYTMMLQFGDELMPVKFEVMR